MHICKCGGTIRQHPLTETETNTREAWTCNECGRYEVIEKQLNKGNELTNGSRHLLEKRIPIPIDYCNF